MFGSTFRGGKIDSILKYLVAQVVLILLLELILA